MWVKNILFKAIKAPVRLLSYTVNKMRFGAYSLTTVVLKPLRVNGSANIYLGEKVIVGKYSWIATKTLYGNNPNGQGGAIPKLVVKKGCSIGDFAHIYATGQITLEEDVLLANFVYISDNQHGFEDISTPVIKQPIVQKKYVTIGSGSWIGEHVCIIGANVGKHCVIGANSVVTHDIPDYSIAVGSPARVIKQYNFDTHQWEKK